MIDSIAKRLQELLVINSLSRLELNKCFEAINADYKPYTDSGYLYRESLHFKPQADFNKYSELLYATLCSWNMNERGARLQEFGKFRSSIAKCYRISRNFSSLGLSDLNLQKEKEISRLFHCLNVVADGKPPLVTASKCLHFLLPNLLLPIDGRYTLPFFKISRESAKSNPLKAYLSVINLSQSFLNEHSSILNRFLDDQKNPNFPKLIDNLIIYSMRKYRAAKTSSLQPATTNAVSYAKNDKNSRLTLHEAIVKILEEQGRPLTTREIAEELNRTTLYTKHDGSTITSFQVHGRTKNYPHLFARDKTMVTLKH